MTNPNVSNSGAIASGDSRPTTSDEIEIGGRRYITVKQFCARIGISTRTFGRWHAARSGPPCIRVGAKVNLIDLEKAATWLSGQELGSTPPTKSTAVK